MFGSSLSPVVCRRALIYVICVCLGIVVSNTYCVVFLFCLSSSCVLDVASFSGSSIFIAPSVFSNVYLHQISNRNVRQYTIITIL